MSETNRMNGLAAGEPDLALLFARARSGCGDALGQLLERYRRYLALLVRVQIGHYLQPKIDVDDILQETSLQVHRSITRFRGNSESEFLAWLRRILGAVLANQVRLYYGTKRRDARMERELISRLDQSSQALEDQLIASQTSPSEQAARREQAVVLANALEQLPEDYREVIILRHLQQLTFPQIAQRMERTEASVKNLWVRALARLRLVMEDRS
jgi:RNA polymerase sigma-70 factor, ECF subfamily